MLVTFRANAKVHNRYRPGKIYTEELTPLLEALLRKDVHLSLIDPPSLDQAVNSSVVHRSSPAKASKEVIQHAKQENNFSEN